MPTQPSIVREFVDKATSTPFDALPGVLEGFTWHYEKVTRVNTITVMPGCMLEIEILLNRLNYITKGLSPI